MADNYFIDATSADIERLKGPMARLAVAFQAMQREVTQDMDLRDQMIVTLGSLDMCQVAIERAVKQNASSRFARSVRKSLLIARKFLGKSAYMPPDSK